MTQSRTTAHQTCNRLSISPNIKLLELSKSSFFLKSIFFFFHSYWLYHLITPSPRWDVGATVGYKVFGAEVHTLSGFPAQNGGCTQGHEAAQTAYKITTGAGRFNVKGRCPDVSLIPMPLILRNPAGLLLISGKTLLTGSSLPLCPLN